MSYLRPRLPPVSVPPTSEPSSYPIASSSKTPYLSRPSASVPSNSFPSNPPLPVLPPDSSRAPSLPAPSSSRPPLPSPRLLKPEVNKRSEKAQSPPPSAIPEAQTFEHLMEKIRTSNALPLLVRKVFEACSSHDVHLPKAHEKLESVEEDYISLAHYAQDNGLDDASRRHSSYEVFFTALLASLDAFKKKRAGYHAPDLLRATLDHGNEITRLSITPRLSHQVSPGFHPASESPSRGAYSPGSVLAPLGAITEAADREYHKYAPMGVSAPARPKLSPEARGILESWFQEHINNPYPSDTEKVDLARKCNIQLSQVNNFFGNKRMRIKRKMMSLSYGRGRSAGKHGLIASSVLAPKTKWRAVVLSNLDSTEGLEAIGASRQPLSGVSNHIGPSASVARQASPVSARDYIAPPLGEKSGFARAHDRVGVLTRQEENQRETSAYGTENRRSYS